jgi:quinol monooxygenase YgiN
VRCGPIWSAVFLLAAAVLLHGQASSTVYVATYAEVGLASARQGEMLMAEYARATRGDAGNLSAEAFQEIGRANRFVLVEAWRDPPGLAAHEQASHTVAFRDRLKRIQVAPDDQRILRGFAVDPMPAAPGANAVYVVTHVDVPGNRRAEAEALLTRLSDASRHDAGRMRYDIYQQLDPRTNHFTMFAAWSSRSAFDANAATVHAKDFREALGPLLGALFDERLYQPVRP